MRFSSRAGKPLARSAVPAYGEVYHPSVNSPIKRAMLISDAVTYRALSRMSRRQ